MEEVKSSVADPDPEDPGLFFYDPDSVEKKKRRPKSSENYT